MEPGTATPPGPPEHPPIAAVPTPIAAATAATAESTPVARDAGSPARAADGGRLSAVERALGAPFGVASAVRRARIFHPDGLVVRGTLVVTGTGLGGSPVLTAGARRPVLVRFSRGFGVPEPLPDVLGVAVKLPDAGGPGRDQDLLMVTVPGTGALARVFVPAPASDALPYSSLLPVRAGGQRLLFGARVALTPAAGGRLHALRTLEDVWLATRRGRLCVELRASGVDGRTWWTVGTVEPHEVLPARAAEQLAFDPWHDGAGLAPAGLLNRLRRGAYAASRRGRAAR